MSFILDALKKSESDRQRQSGPALFEVRVASPKTQLPLWALGVGALLLINIVIVGWLLSRRSAHAESAAAIAPAATSSVVASPAPMPVTTMPVAPMPAAPMPAAPVRAATTPAAPAVGEPTLGNGSIPGAAVTSTPTPIQGPAPTSTAPSAALGGQLPVVPAPAAGPAQSADDGAMPAAANPDDYAPAKEGGSAPLFKGHVRRSTDGGYTLYQDAAVAPGANLPQLRLDLHVYAARPEDRFALINMHRVHEGDTLPEGVRVESINPEGVMLSHNGSKFLLPRD